MAKKAMSNKGYEVCMVDCLGVKGGSWLRWISPVQMYWTCVDNLQLQHDMEQQHRTNLFHYWVHDFTTK